jgi:type I restriction enzyme S subunit
MMTTYGGARKIGDLFTCRKEPGIPGLPTLAVTINNGIIERNGIDRKMETNLPPEEHLLVREGDIAYNMMRMWQGASGRADQDGIISPAYVVYGPTDEIDSKFAAYLFKSQRIVYLFWAYSYGITGDRLRLYPKDFEKVPVDIPSTGEQKTIATILSTWDHAIEKTEALIAAKERRKTGLMQRLLTGNVRFGEFVKSQARRKTKSYDLPEDWGYPTIGDVAVAVSKKNGTKTSLPVLSCTKHSGLVDSLAYFGKQVFSKDLSTYKVVPRGAFAYATNHIEEGSIGYQDLHDKALISPMYTVFKTSGVVHDGFLFKLLKTEWYRHIFQTRTSASVDRRGSLRWKEFAKIHIPLPSMDEQGKIAEVLDKAEQEIEEHRNQLVALKEQKKGLMQQLLTGKVRVKS